MKWYCFLVKSWGTENRSKSCRYNAATPGILLTRDCSYMTFCYVHKGRDPELSGPKKIMFHVIKAWYYLNMYLTHQNDECLTIWKTYWDEFLNTDLNINLIMLLLYNSLVKNTNCWNAVVFERDVFFAWKVSVFGVCWSVFNPNPGKYGPEKFQIRTLFTQWRISSLLKVKLSFFGCKVPIRVFGWSNYWFLASKTSK